MVTIVVDVKTLLSDSDAPRPLPMTHSGDLRAPGESEHRRRSRWDPPPHFVIPGVPRYLPTSLTPEQEDALLLRARMEEIQYHINSGQLGINPARERSPSPPPMYDKDGKRTNTREQRMREKLQHERANLISEAMKMYPEFKPPADARAHLRKTMKVFIPEKEFPEYNFIGLIIGPRGNTQKRLEKESGAKISIRGRGSLKEGKAKKGSGAPDDDEPLHVQIVAETDEQLQKAYSLVKPLLTPMDESKNEWKKQQLRELAEINGTLRERTFFQPLPDYDAGVTCAICGDGGHPDTDCPFKGKGTVPTLRKQKIENEFDSFMREIGETPANSAPDPIALMKQQQSAAAAAAGQAEQAEKSYAEFMASLQADSKPRQQQAAVSAVAASAMAQAQAQAMSVPVPPPPGFAPQGVPGGPGVPGAAPGAMDPAAQYAAYQQGWGAYPGWGAWPQQQQQQPRQ
eukprot:m51a1_g3212 putative splicing factor 1 (457) ;mRNA; r:32386-34271